MTLLRISFRLLARDWRSGYLNLLLIALLVAVTSHNTIGFLTERIENAMETQASQLLGGDLVIRSPTPAPEFEQLTLNSRDQIRIAHTAEFSSVVSAGDAMQLASLKSVSSNYPLKAPLRVADAPYQPDRAIQNGPKPGQAWMEARLINMLNIKMGDSVEVGDTQLQLTKVLTFEPDRGGSFYSFVPRLMMNADDLAAANLIQLGSRVDYYYQFSGPHGAIKRLEQSVTDKLQPGQKILTINSQQRTVSSALNRAQGYLKLASLMAILLAGVALAMGAQFFSELRYDASALLRCFGLRSKQILSIFVFQLITLAVMGGVVGGILGWGFHFIIMELLADLLPESIPMPSMTPFISGCLLAVVIMLGFSLPSLIQLQRTSPLRVLRKDLVPAPVSKALFYIIPLTFVLTLMTWYLQDAALISALLIASLVAWCATLLLSKLFSHLLQWISRFGSLWVQAGLRNLSRRQASTRVQLLGFGLTAMAMLLVLLVRGELINSWQTQLPTNAPNHFVLNVLPDEAEDFAEFLQRNDVESQPLYPVVRGRLTHINQKPVVEVVSKENPEGDVPGAINRELNLSWASDLPSDNKITVGSWWSSEALPGRQVSIEEKLAAKLHINMGDELTFFVAGTSFDATVHSFRSVRWESFQPNFYMLFEPEDLKDLPRTYLTSFHLSAEKKQILKPLVQAFPAITLLEVDTILRQVRMILAQVSAAVEFIIMFVLAAGLTITFATLTTTMPQRYQEGALMRTLGASRKQLVWQQLSEFFAIGFLAGLVACAGTELARFAIYYKIIQLPYAPSPWIWIIVPPLLGALIGLAGKISSQRILRRSPMDILRD